MTVPSQMSLRRIREAMHLQVRVAYATSWEALIDTHTRQALQFVTEFATRIPVLEGLDLFFRVTAVPDYAAIGGRWARDEVHLGTRWRVGHHEAPRRCLAEGVASGITDHIVGSVEAWRVANDGGDVPLSCIVRDAQYRQLQSEGFSHLQGDNLIVRCEIGPRRAHECRRNPDSA